MGILRLRLRMTVRSLRLRLGMTVRLLRLRLGMIACTQSFRLFEFHFYASAKDFRI